MRDTDKTRKYPVSCGWTTSDNTTCLTCTYYSSSALISGRGQAPRQVIIFDNLREERERLYILDIKEDEFLPQNLQVFR